MSDSQIMDPDIVRMYENRFVPQLPPSDEVENTTIKENVNRLAHLMVAAVLEDPTFNCTFDDDIRGWKYHIEENGQTSDGVISTMYFYNKIHHFITVAIRVWFFCMNVEVFSYLY